MNAFEYFLEITKIPRESFHEEKIAKYICEQAEKMNLKFIKDKFNNVQIFKDNNSKKTIILQAHLDMVCEKLQDKQFNFNTESLHTYIKDDYIYADGTTLGADDGFGVALILEALENYNVGYPNIQAFFTTQEEKDMGGAKNIDCSKAKSNYMIGLDGTNSNEIITSCAGSVRFNFKYKIKDFINNELQNKLYTYKLSINGLLGGHSGEDINKNRANANMIVFKILNEFNKINSINLNNFNSCSKENAISRECEIIFQSICNFNELQKILKKSKKLFNKEFPLEKNANFDIIQLNNEIVSKSRTLSNEDSNNIINFVINFKNGIIKIIDKQVIYSINLANIQYNNQELIFNLMFRFNDRNYKKIIEEYKKYGKKYNFQYNELNVATNFDNSNNRDLQNLCEQAYLECGYKNLKTTNIHAGLEGGIFCEKIPNLKIVVLGADLFNIHTPNEKMKISSLEKVSNWLKQILQNFNKK